MSEAYAGRRCYKVKFKVIEKENQRIKCNTISISLFEKFIIYHRKNNTFLSASLIK